MARTRRRNTGTDHAGRVGLAHGRAWNKTEWYVPFRDSRAVIYHGHEDPDDHSDCGPKIFCCPKAATLIMQRYPDEVLADAEWQFTDGQHLASWMGQNGPKVYYFFFCDPEDSMVVCFCGISAPEVRDVLLKRLSLDQYLEKADRIRGVDE